jgi:glycine cleavage system pyridoxal-binding protein P
VYLSLVGKSGLVATAQLCLQKSHYLAERIRDLTGFKLRYPGPFFKEFVVEGPTSPASLIRRFSREGILAGIDLGRLSSSWRGGLLVAVTEKRTREEMDRYTELLRPLEARAQISRALARQLELNRTPTEAPRSGQGPANETAEVSLQAGGRTGP